jgi:PhoD-like phosphatase
MALSRRRFFRALGRGLAVVGGAMLGACDLLDDPKTQSPALKRFFVDEFEGTGIGWGDEWSSFRYEALLERIDGAGVFRFEPAVGQSVREDQTHYMTQPVVVHGTQARDVAVSCRVQLDGLLEGGVLARSAFDESYALLVSPEEALLCRYSVAERQVLARQELPPGVTDCSLRLVAEGTTIEGSVVAGDRRLSLVSREADLLNAGFAGVIGNPLDRNSSSAVYFREFAVDAARTTPRVDELLYRFTGAIVPDGETYKARVTARTVMPTDIIFEYADNEDLVGAQRVGPFAPRTRLGSVHAWLDGLMGDTTYYWRAVPASDNGIASPLVRFRSPPPTGAASKFVFASCTTGRGTSYPSFGTAAAQEPAFYLHAGDWGYADQTSISYSADHFQARWIRLLRTSDGVRLFNSSPLMFWQDDHDYNCRNGWSETVKPFTVPAFDELHANPSDEYFDVRWGDLHIWCIDCRLHATNPDEPDDARKSRLGFEQKAWLKSGMAESDARVKVVASPMVFRNKTTDDPGWHSVYSTERDELLEFFSSLDGLVFVLSGDAHGQRLIHHFEFGELYEVNCSGTDLPTAFQENFDPEHTLAYTTEPAVAIVDLDADGPQRRVKVSVVHGSDGAELFSHEFPLQ